MLNNQSWTIRPSNWSTNGTHNHYLYYNVCTKGTHLTKTREFSGSRGWQYEISMSTSLLCRDLSELGAYLPGFPPWGHMTSDSIFPPALSLCVLSKMAASIECWLAPGMSSAVNVSVSQWIPRLFVRAANLIITQGVVGYADRYERVWKITANTTRYTHKKGLILVKACE